MKNTIFGMLGSKYFKDKIKENEKRIDDLNETLSEKNARLLGFYSGLTNGLIGELEIHEKNQ